jgi:glycosyltransferase involved in cell wall biosynthesis
MVGSYPIERIRMKINDPLVSVLICSYNAERFVELTIRSVSNQTYSNMEILVLDNNSSDRTVDVLERLAGEDPRLRFYRGNQNLGAYGGLNYLLERAAGEYIAINDHDDIWHAEKIVRQVEFLERNSEYVGCGTAMINYYEKYDTFVVRRQPVVAMVAWHTSLVFRRGSCRYDTSLKIANDFHFMKNTICQNSRCIHNFKEPYVLRKVHADYSNLSTKWIAFKNTIEIVHSKVGLFDKVAMLYRLLLPRWLADHILLKFLIKRNIVAKAEVNRSFGAVKMFR